MIIASKSMTSAQRGAFWKAFAAACRNQGLTASEDRDAYRKTVMVEETGKHHLADLNRTDDFDRVMARFASDADDFARASKYVIGDAGRLAFLVRVVLDQIMQLKGVPTGSTAARDYLVGVLGQSKIQCARDPRDSAYWLDLTQDSLQAVFAMLDTHRRRLMRQLCPSSKPFLGFDPSAVYQPKPGGGLTILRRSDAYSEPTIRLKVR